MKGTHDGPTSRHVHPRHEMPSASTEGRSYLKLASELLIDFIIMFFVMYAMIASIDHLYFNIDNVYMTLMMVAPMAVLMLLFMRHMYRSNTANGIVAGLAIAVFAFGWFGMRGQIAVGDEQLVRAMIPITQAQSSCAAKPSSLTRKWSICAATSSNHRNAKLRT
jgi:ABC-type uncharacterized transport system permease subunit